MSPKQQERLAAVMEGFGRIYPDWRIGQIISNVAFWARGPGSEAAWDIEDEEFLAAAEAHLAQRTASASSAAAPGHPTSKAY
ncbi:MAG TPA: hypothetical protein VN541_22600 [Tepidisphaeraceae bacterium]|nr:hypothetical protein [Tepidisphaeraceae bacterium]